MSIKKSIRNKIKFVRYTPIGRYLHSEYWRIRGKRESGKYDDYAFIYKNYKKKCCRDLDLKNPKRLTEKLQWLKLFWRDDDMITACDKYSVREYLEKLGYHDMCNELIGIYDSADEIDFDSLPNQFVLKATHGSGWNFICKDKSKENLFWWKKTINSWMKRNLYWYGREWNYESLKPRILIEKYLEDATGGLMDYKITCLSGNPIYMQVDIDRYGDHKRGFIDREGNILDFDDGLCTNRIKEFDFSDVHREMYRIADDICSRFPYVRVDFYYFNNKIYIGELTFFEASGFYSYNPDECDYIFGEKLVLPEPNYNLDLYNELMR